MSIGKNIVGVMAPITVYAVAFEALSRFLGIAPSIGLPIWPILGVVIVFFLFYAQIDMEAARDDNDVLDFLAGMKALWLVAALPVILIVAMLLPQTITVGVFGLGLALVYLVGIPAIFVSYERKHPGWYARYTDALNKKALLEAAVVREAMTVKGAADVGLGFVAVGAGLGLEFMYLWNILAYQSASVGFLVAGIFFVAIGALMVLNRLGYSLWKKSVIDGKPLVDE